MINIGDSGVLKYLTTYLPMIIETMGYHDAKVHLMTTPPFVIACICCLLVGYSASRWNEHGYHLMFCVSVALLGFILMVTPIHQNQVKYVATCIVCAGILSVIPLLLSWLTNNIFGRQNRLIAIGFVMSLGQIGGIILPLVRSNF
jgi:sugar phosphate permease